MEERMGRTQKQLLMVNKIQCPSSGCDCTDFSLVDDETYEEEQIYESLECGVPVAVTVL